MKSRSQPVWGSVRKAPRRLWRASAAALGSALLLTGAPAFAQVIPSTEQPGRELQRFQDRPAPQAQPGGPPISLPSTQAPEGAADIRLRIRSVRVTGSTVYSNEELAPLYADIVGRTVPLKAVYDLAMKITAKYGGDGYVLSRAIVPVQELEPSGASVRIEVVEGYVSEVQWPRDKLARYRDFFTDYSAKITADRPINVRTLERYLLLANDLPGLKFTTALKAAPRGRGASVLVVEVQEKPVDAALRLDNRGTAARGPYQFLAQATLNNLMGRHESLTVTYAGVPRLRELQLIAPSYRQVVNSEGLTFFANGSVSWGKPGTVALETLEFETRSVTLETGLSNPVVRTRERNLNLTALVFMSDNNSDILRNPFNIDRLRGVRLKAEGDIADTWNGINQASLIFSQGISGLGSTENGHINASRTAGRVDFSKVELYASRLQPLGSRFSALIAAYGQYAFTSLLAPEQCGFGGRQFGRAFDPSELLGDRCWQLSAELRYDIPSAVTLMPNVQAYVFTDKGQADTISPAVGTASRVTGASAGGGIRLGWQNYFNADLSATKAVEGPRNDWRFFLVTTARY